MRELSEWDHFLRMIGYAAIAAAVCVFAIGSIWLVWEEVASRACRMCLGPKSGYGPRCVKCQRAVDDARWHAELRKHNTREGREEIA